MQATRARRKRRERGENGVIGRRGRAERLIVPAAQLGSKWGDECGKRKIATQKIETRLEQVRAWARCTRPPICSGRRSDLLAGDKCRGAGDSWHAKQQLPPVVVILYPW